MESIDTVAGVLRGRVLAIGALVAIVAVATPGISPASAAPAASPTPTIHWRACGGGFQCGAITVPVDWSQPGGPQLSLAVARHPATIPSQRLGSLVINYGRPPHPRAAPLRPGGPHH